MVMILITTRHRPVKAHSDNSAVLYLLVRCVVALLPEAKRRLSAAPCKFCYRISVVFSLRQTKKRQIYDENLCACIPLCVGI